MFWPLAVILVAVAGFSALVVRRRTGRRDNYRPSLDPDQLKGFVLVGAAALALLAGAVVVLGLLDRADGRAESLAVLGFLAYGVYLAAAVAIMLARRP